MCDCPNSSHLSLGAVAKGQIDPGADFTALPGDNANVIVWNMANFWQYTFSEMAGTLLHEYIHLGAPDLSDTEIQQKLGLDVDDKDHSNISEKLANDCFGGASVPYAQ